MFCAQTKLSGRRGSLSKWPFHYLNFGKQMWQKRTLCELGKRTYWDENKWYFSVHWPKPNTALQLPYWRLSPANAPRTNYYYRTCSNWELQSVSSTSGQNTRNLDPDASESVSYMCCSCGTVSVVTSVSSGDLFEIQPRLLAYRTSWWITRTAVQEVAHVAQPHRLSCNSVLFVKIDFFSHTCP